MNYLIDKIFNTDTFKRNRLYALEKYAQIGKISSGLIHDLMSPITALNIQIELLDRNKINSKDYLNSIKIAADNINHYIYLIKDYINNNSSEEIFPLNKTIKDATNLIAYKAAKKDVKIILNSDSEYEIYGNRLHIYQIIINLISNAIDSYKEDQKNKKVLIDIRNKNKFLRIRIQDFGTGIESTRLKRIFDPFISKKGFESTGIGLPTIKSLIEEKFNGYIEVQSEYGHGSIFDVYLKKVT